MNFNPDDEFMSSSPFSSPIGDEAAFVEEEGSHSDSSDSMDEDAGDRTFVSTAGETTMGDMTLAKMDMDVEDETARQPIFKKPMQWRFEGGLPSSPPVLKSEAAMPAPEQEVDGEGEQMMDVTKAVGGLLSTSNQARPPPLSFSPKTPQKLDDDGEATMDITRAVGGLLTSRPGMSQPQHQEESEDMMDITRPVGGILSAATKEKQNTQPAHEDEEMDMTMGMDITRPIGGILSNMANKLKKSIGFVVPQHHQQQPEADEMDMDMDITRPIGGIVSAKRSSPTPNATSEIDLNEDMTMEFTAVLGGIIGQAPNQNGRRRSSLGTGRRGGLLMSGDSWAKDQAEKQSLMDKQLEDEMDMDITVALGGILSAPAVNNVAEERDFKPAVAYPAIKEDEKASELVQVVYPALPEPKEDDEEGQEMDESFSMDMTVNLGRILQSRSAVAKTVSPQEKPTSASAPVPDPKPSTPEAFKEITPAQFDSPTPLNKRNTRRSSGAASTITTQRVTRGAHRKSLELQNDSTSQLSPKTPKQMSVKKATPAKATLVEMTPTKKRSSPQTQSTPEAKVATTQSEGVTRQENVATQVKVATPQAKAASPRQLATPQSVSSSTPKSTPITSAVKKSKSPAKSASNLTTPRCVDSTPKRSEFEVTTSSILPRTPLKGVGFDKPGLGSPAISQKLSRRKSLGEDTMTFSPVALPSALIMACRMDAQKREHEEREEKLRREEEEKAIDLKSRIQLLTPRKQGERKSLVLGSLVPRKRPLESTPESGRKRRKSGDRTSNVVEVVEEAKEVETEAEVEGPELTKSITPSKRVFASLPDSSKKKTPQKATPQKTVTTAEPPTSSTLDPHTQVRIAVSFGEDKEVEDLIEDDDEEDKISLQQFLQIIDISFLELTASNRHTNFKPVSKRRSTDMDEEPSLCDRLKAAACAAPMLEMFQYLCRDLERHIKEGRDVIDEIEEIAEAENPPLFQEYIRAPADIKALMDNQFKNIKTNARLTAKRDWYQWRMKNVDSVKDVLQRNLDGLRADERFVEEQKTVLDPLLPDIKKSWERVRYQLRKLEDMKQCIDMDDQDELMAARSRLADILNKIETTRGQTQQKRQQTEKIDKDIKIKEAKESQLVASIEEAERIKEMNRGWSENEVRTWKSHCAELEKSSGWSISKALADGRLEMMYMRQVKLLLDPKGLVAPTVEYVCPASQKLSDCKRLPAVESEFFITGLNSILSQERIPKTVLDNIASYWQDALVIVDNICRLRTHHYTEVKIAADGNLHVRATILVQELRSKMEVSFVVGKESLTSQGAGVRVVYGAISQQAVQDTLMRWAGEWREGVSEVVGRCLEGRRGGVVVGVKG